MYGKESEGEDDKEATTQKEKKPLNVKIHANAKRKKYPASSDKLVTSTQAWILHTVRFDRYRFESFLFNSIDVSG